MKTDLNNANMFEQDVLMGLKAILTSVEELKRQIKELQGGTNK